MAQRNGSNYVTIVVLIFLSLGVIYLFNRPSTVVRDTVTRYVPTGGYHPGPHHGHGHGHGHGRGPRWPNHRPRRHWHPSHGSKPHGKKGAGAEAYGNVFY